MQAMEVYAQKTDFPIIGPTSGYLCYQVARMIGARRIFELGSGYGAASLPVIVEKLRPGGVLIVDNMLWHGNIFNDKDKTPATMSVRELTEILT
jgi:predicted O-methyltransferase YrrM